MFVNSYYRYYTPLLEYTVRSPCTRIASLGECLARPNDDGVAFVQGSFQKYRRRNKIGTKTFPVCVCRPFREKKESIFPPNKILSAAFQCHMTSLVATRRHLGKCKLRRNVFVNHKLSVNRGGFFSFIYESVTRS